MSKEHQKKRVRFSKLDVDFALNPRLPADADLIHETRLPEPEQDDLPVPRKGGEEEGPIKSTNPEFAASLRARHRKEIDELKVGEAVDISVSAEVALAEEADEADTELRFTDDGIPIEPFNLRSERAEGYFDEEGNYVAYRGGDDTDAWLETLPAGPVDGQWKRDRTAKPSSSKGGVVGDEQRPEMTQLDRRIYRQRLIRALQPGETVLGALKRLGTPEDGSADPEAQTATNAQKLHALRARLAGRVPEVNRGLFERITEDASQLLNAGDTDIYSATREELVADLPVIKSLQGPERYRPVRARALPNGAGITSEAEMLTERLAGPAVGAGSAEEVPSAIPQVPADPDADIFADETMTDAQEPSGEAAVGSTEATDGPQIGLPEAGDESSKPSNRRGGKDSTQLAGFAFDEGSGMYYNTELGCYFDAKRQLYGDAASGRWYAFNRGKYELVSSS